MKKNRILVYILTLFICITSILQLSSCSTNFESKKSLSIIVPVYNVENYLGECLDSLINQTYKDIEIICINDGSTDNSLNILKEYKKKDNRIIIVEQENKGVSATRNNGILMAKGDYITFVDSDDFLDLNIYEKCMESISQNDADIAVFDFICFPDQISHKKLESKVYHNQRFEAIDENNIGGDTVWNKIYRRSMIIDNNILFKEDIQLGEDSLFTVTVFPCAKTVALVPEVFYHYRVNRQASASYSIVTKKRMSSVINISKYLIDDYMSRGYTERKNWLLNYSLLLTYDRIENLESQEEQKFYSTQILEILDNKLLNQIDSISQEHENMIKKLRNYASL